MKNSHEDIQTVLTWLGGASQKVLTPNRARRFDPTFAHGMVYEWLTLNRRDFTMRY